MLDARFSSGLALYVDYDERTTQEEEASLVGLLHDAEVLMPRHFRVKQSEFTTLFFPDDESSADPHIDLMRIEEELIQLCDAIERDTDMAYLLYRYPYSRRIPFNSDVRQEDILRYRWHPAPKV